MIGFDKLGDSGIGVKLGETAKGHSAIPMFVSSAAAAECHADASESKTGNS